MISYFQNSQIRHNLYGFIALTAILYCFFYFDSDTKYPGINAIIPVTAAALFILSSQSWLNKSFLTCRMMVGIGLISYPLYLWHFPLMAYAKILSSQLSDLKILILLIISFILAGLTYRFVERPLRFGKKSKLNIFILLMSMCVMGILGLTAYYFDGFVNRLPADIRKIIAIPEDSIQHYRNNVCLLNPSQPPSEFATQCAGKNHNKPLVLIWGDSYAAAFYAGLNHANKDNKFDIAQFTASSCPPFMGFSAKIRPYCKETNDFVLRKIAELKPKTVILHNQWGLGFTEIGFDSLLKTINALKDLKKDLKIEKIIILGPVPTWDGPGLPENVIEYYFHNHSKIIPQYTNYHLNNKTNILTHLELQKISHRLDVEYISPLDILCNTDGCLSRLTNDGNKLTSFDRGHLTLPAAAFLANTILANHDLI